MLACTINDTYETVITRGLIKLIENCHINVLTQAMLFSIPRHKSTQSEDIPRQREHVA